MEPKTTRLMSHCINYRRIYLLCFFSLFLILTAGAMEYIVTPAPGDEFGISVTGENVQIVEDTIEPYWHFLLWLAVMQLLSVIDILLYHTKLIFTILGFKITEHTNLLDNPNRNLIYSYIETNPGAHISEIVNKIGLNRGTVKYHINALKVQNKIETYNDDRKIRYFGSNLACDEVEKKVISVLKNVTNKRIISEIRNKKCDTNIALALEIGVSRATISWHMRYLKEIGFVKETKIGRNVIYEINPSYNYLIDKYK
ncbi:MAG TPA: winged helix-turn-helix transcriptional regulator [Methanosarcina sp.]|nr:winged helix-turn-helix transcriptional regulator [Methanosarcina sp.]